MPLRWTSSIGILACVVVLSAQSRPHAERLFAANCAPCHGPRGNGGKGADLTRPKLSRAADDQALFNIIRRGIPGTEMPGTRHLLDSDIHDLITYIHDLSRSEQPSVSGDPLHGKELYRTKGNCGSCHTVQGHGGTLGPDLTDIGARRSAAYLRQSILDPEASVTENYFVYRLITAIPDNFLQVRIVTKDGRRITGARVNEDPFSIQVRDASDRLYSFWKSDLAELHKDWGKSPMPSYRAMFSDGELDDLVAYLASLRGGP